MTKNIFGKLRACLKWFTNDFVRFTYKMGIQPNNIFHFWYIKSHFHPLRDP